jgi:purine-binding chemotaxis protein CheW
MPTTPATPAHRAILTFSVAGETLAIPARDVAEIIKPGNMTRVPHAPASLLGVTNFRGSVLPVVSLAEALHGGKSDLQSGRVVVVDKGRTPVGILVDEITALSESSQGRRFDLDSLLEKEFGVFTQRASSRFETTHRKPEASLDTARASTAFICFSLAGQDYALSLDHVREVTAFPKDIAELPKTDAAMIGVTELRGHLVPMVALRALLGLPTQGLERTTARVVSVRIGDRVVGLVVDNIRAIRRLAEHNFDRVPKVLTRGSGEAQIEAICRHDGALISILTPAKLFDQKTSAQILAEVSGGDHDMAAAARADEGEQFVLFQLGAEHYGIPIGSVDEIVRRPDTLTRVPRAPAFVEGMMNLRGKMVPVIDQRQRFAVGDASRRGTQKIIVVTVAGVQTGIVVDKVTEILAIPPAELRSAPQFKEDNLPVFDRIAMVERDGRMILLVDPQALLDRAERDVLASLGADVAAPVS